LGAWGCPHLACAETHQGNVNGPDPASWCLPPSAFCLHGDPSSFLSPWASSDWSLPAVLEETLVMLSAHSSPGGTVCSPNLSFLSPLHPGHRLLASVLALHPPQTPVPEPQPEAAKIFLLEIHLLLPINCEFLELLEQTTTSSVA
jgi:hypothetical protein